MGSPRRPWGLPVFALAGLATGLVAAWTGDWFPGGYDEITHLEHARNAAHQVAEQGATGAWEALLGRVASEEREAYWPGAPWLLTAPFVWLFSGVLQAPLLVLPWVGGAAAGGLGLGLAPHRRVGGAWLALLPALALATLAHYTPTAFVAGFSALALGAQVRSRGFTRPGWTGLWGLAAVVALLSDRLTGALLLAPPVLVAGFTLRGWRRRLPLLGGALALVTLAVLPFYRPWWTSWGQGLVGSGSADPVRWGHRALELGAWLPLQGWGLAATGAFVLAAVGWGIRKGVAVPRGEPERAPERRVWAAALPGALFLLLFGESGQNHLGGLAVIPLAALGAEGARRALATRTGGRVAAALTVFAVGAHLARAGLLPAPGGALAPLPLRSSLSGRAEYDARALAFLDRGAPVAVVDLLQAKDSWSAHWLHYRVGVERAALPVAWSFRREHAAWAPGDPVLREPCALAALLVLHGERPWHRPHNVERPLGFVGLPAEAEARWREAVTEIRDCYEVYRVEDAPGRGTVTFLVNPGARPVSTGADGCPTDMVRIPGGLHRLGRQRRLPPMDYALPDQRVSLSPFCIDRHEYPNREGELPLTRVTWEGARRLCRARGRRLCTDREWAAACRGPEGRRYAYGNRFEAGRCHTEGATHFDRRDLRPIGSAPRCATPLGVYDLNGSVSEWVDATHPGPPFPDDGGPAGRSCHVVRGGTLWDATYGQDCLSRHWHARGHRQDDDGFRCCLDAPPSAETEDGTPAPG